MIGVTLFGLLLTPAFYVVCRRLARRRQLSVPHPDINAHKSAVGTISASPEGEVRS